MLIRERLKTGKFSDTEKVLVDYLLEKKASVRHMTVKEIGEKTYTSPSLLIRIAHKMGYDGWESLKNAYCDEEEYLASHFTETDANLPFSEKDSSMTIAGKIISLKKEALDDTLALLEHDALSRAVRMLQRASSLEVFGVSSNALIAEEFALKMSRIGYPVHVHQLQSELVFNAALCPSSACAMMISYSGETTVLKQCMELLQQQHVPVMALTGLGNNTIAEKADVVLHISTREKLYSKIANYVTDESILALLDILYSAYFAKDYERNLQKKTDVSRRVEKDHYASSAILKEEEHDTEK